MIACPTALHKQPGSDLGNASTVQFQRTCAVNINKILYFVDLRDPTDFVAEVHHDIFWLCLKNSPAGIKNLDIMKRQEGTFCALMIPVPVQVDHKGYICIAESHRLERSIMVLTINRDYTLAKPALSPTMTK